MSERILAIRPEPGLSATRAAGLAAGLSIDGHPLFAIREIEWDPPTPQGVDGLLLGSANAIRHGGPALGAYRGKPVYAVGEATAQAARAAGLAVAAVGEGGLQALLDTLGGASLHLLRLAGAEHVALVPPEGITLATRIAYESVPQPMPGALAAALAEGAIVLLHSAAAARHFASECDRLAIARSGIRLAALGPRIAKAAGEGWGELRIAQAPRETALLALASDMCH